MPARVKVVFERLGGIDLVTIRIQMAPFRLLLAPQLHFKEFSLQSSQ